MKRRCLSPLTTTTEDDEFLYAVFDSYERGAENGYFVYKGDHSSAASAAGDDSLADLGDPIWSSLDPSNSGVKLVSGMIVFSSPSSIYFAGGYKSGTGEYQRDAFRLDLDKLNSSSDSGTSIHPVPIDSMNSNKPSPLTFGPINDRFYIFSPGGANCSFESFDLNTEKWDSPPLPGSNPDIEGYLSVMNDRHDLSFRVQAAAVCDSNIYLTPKNMGPLFVFYTKTQTWGIISCWTGFGLLSLPFTGKAVPLTVGNEILSIVMPYTFIPCAVYKCPYSPVDENFNLPETVCDGSYGFLEPFGVVGEVGGMEDHLFRLGYGKWDGELEMLFWSFDNKPGRICIVPCEPRVRPRRMRSYINICELTLVEGIRFKVEVKSIVTYKPRADRSLMPKHFLFAS